MIELAIDTATAACSVALRRADGETFELRPPAARLGERPAHTTELLPAVLELTLRAGIELGEVGRVAIGIGPGAFTGLRIGVATARAIATANRCGLVPVSSLAALAANGGTAVIDARRGEFFHRVGGRDQLAGPKATVAAIGAQGGAAIGDGALRLREELVAAGVEVPGPDDARHVISAAAILDLADDGEQRRPDEVVPNYIRPPDAKVSAREHWLVSAS